MPKKNVHSLVSRVAQLSGDPESVIKDRAKFDRIARLMIGGDVTGAERELGAEIDDDTFANVSSELHSVAAKKNPKLTFPMPYRMKTEEVSDPYSGISFAPMTRIDFIDKAIIKAKDPMGKRKSPLDENQGKGQTLMMGVRG